MRHEFEAIYWSLEGLAVGEQLNRVSPFLHGTYFDLSVLLVMIKNINWHFFLLIISPFKAFAFLLTILQ